jgi:hypothetical protein
VKTKRKIKVKTNKKTGEKISQTVPPTNATKKEEPADDGND